MQNQDNHMDELFRKAAENYPLKTGEDNWDDIAAAIAGNSSLVPVVANKTSARKIAKRVLPFLLFLLIGGAPAIYFMGSKKEHASVANSSTKQENVKEYSEKEKTSIAINKTSNETNKPERITALDNKTYLSTKIKIINPVLKQIENKDPVNVEQTNLNNRIAISAVPLDAGQDKETRAVPDKAAGLISTKLKSILEENNQQPLTISTQSENKTGEAPVPVIKNKSKKQKSLYAGIIIGAGFGEVKSQGLTKPGLEGGIRAGYRFNTKFSIETGLLFSKKYYYSDGEYFKMKTASMPAGMQVLSLTGSSALFEIPIKIKYNIQAMSKNNFFTTVGLTSYIMTKEKNNYLALINGSKQNITTTYNKSNKYLAAAIDISAGYEIKINHNKTLRIEPYLQVPLTGIGVGTMPVMSTGLHIGYTLFKN